jgi:hypothetical protein
MLDDVTMFARFAAGLGNFLQHRLTPEDCRRSLQESLRRREESFLLLAKQSIFENPRSPYRPLLHWAGVTEEDLNSLVRKEGIEGSLERLFDAGVCLSLDEFKGRRPIIRTGLEIAGANFDNPLLARQFEGRTGGSRGVSKRLVIDFDAVAHDAVSNALFLEGRGLLKAPAALWRPVPPGSSGLKRCLMHAKLGSPVERWFTQNRWDLRSGPLKSYLFTSCAVYGSRLYGSPLPVPEYTPALEALRVARWLARKKTDGTPAFLDTNVSSGIRTCQAAMEAGLDIADSFLRLGGEPLTIEKARVVAEAGCKAGCHYSMSETGPIGVCCGNAKWPDEVHLLSEKMALIRRQKSLGLGAKTVEPFYLTTLLPQYPKIMLNVDSGDYGEVETRQCGCSLGHAGLDTHLRNIRSYEKLTSEGMHFLGSDILTLVEKILPETFGGGPMDYQFVEQDRDGLPEISIFVSPRLGRVDDRQVIETIIGFLGARSRGDRMMAERWAQARTLKVVRCNPIFTDTSKMLALHVLRKT